MESEDQMVTLLEQEEKNARSKAHFLEIEKKWESLIQCNEEEISFKTLKRYNRFRLRNQLVLRKRPGLLLGFINDHRFPNFQTRELLKVADIVSLTSLKEEDESEIDRVHYLPASDDFSKIRKKLPKGFRPKLFRHASCPWTYAACRIISDAIPHCSWYLPPSTRACCQNNLRNV